MYTKVSGLVKEKRMTKLRQKEFVIVLDLLTI